ncbi:unnamed protein product [Notodromas monacha]|uniref:Xanthine dehydrogenase n=1 Tax=Notodromas monacha TaxID=399045 RepID=A0A7R9C1Y1_9CRUS|nr:unnamed protein product [Notodromas monacha]CAG0924317.1 unnamed protein product [Notodromas monacha]
MRAAGVMQPLIICEQIVQRVAEELKMDPNELRKANLLRTGTKTHYGKVLEDCTLEQCWDECLLQSKFSSRKAEVNSFNKLHDWKKRGISMVPVMFGLAFPGSNLNQAGALVMIYKDGSVLISHAGVEIGQGIHVKLAQIASRVLDIPLESIHTADTATDKIPNATSTAASFTTDLNGPAIKKACEKLVERLRPYKHANPQGGFKDWVQAAYMDRILRTDIVMDIGESLNPAVDIGQIEGAFVQGYGMWMMEDLEFSPSGELRTAGPSNYKIPTSRDVPQEFNVSLLKGSANKHAIYSSKGVGEPPMFLSASVLFAAREAINSRRKQNGIDEYLRLDTPATGDKLRLACGDWLIREAKKTGKVSWRINI